MFIFIIFMYGQTTFPVYQQNDHSRTTVEKSRRTSTRSWPSESEARGTNARTQAPRAGRTESVARATNRWRQRPSLPLIRAVTYSLRNLRQRVLHPWRPSDCDQNTHTKARIQRRFARTQEKHANKCGHTQIYSHTRNLTHRQIQHAGTY